MNEEKIKELEKRIEELERWKAEEEKWERISNLPPSGLL
jgi:hypothetical protein